MYIYIILVFIYFLCMMIERLLGENLNRTIWVILLLLPLFIIAAFRSPTVGNDTELYMRSYNLVTQEGFFTESQSRLEIGYIFYMRVIGLLGLSYFGFQILTTLLTLSSISRFIYKYSEKVAFSFYIFVATRMFFGMMNTSRQYLAIAILLCSIEFIKNRKIIKFTALVLLASIIHFTSIVFLIVYPLSIVKFDGKNTSILIISGIISSAFFDQMINVFVKVTGKYASYLNSGYFNFEGNIAIYLSLLINVLFFLIAVIIKYWQQNEETSLITKVSNEKVWYICCLLTLIISIAGLNATILSRIETYFSVSFLVLIPSMILRIRNKGSKAIISVGVVIGLLASFIVVMIFRPYWTTVFPYEWYWNYVENIL